MNLSFFQPFFYFQWLGDCCGGELSVCFPLLSCKGGHIGLFLSFNLFCLIGWWHRFFELLSGTSVPHHPPLTAGKPLVTASQPAPPQCASCKGAFKGGRHGCQRRFLGHGNPLTFLSGKCCLTGSLCASLHGMPSGNHL